MNLTKAITYTLALAMCACAPTIHVTSDYNKEADFSVFKSYAISKQLPPEDPLKPEYDNELNRSRLINAIHSEMTELGYTLDEQTPEILVDFHIIIKDKTAVTTVHDGPGRYWQGYEVEAFEYEEGSLIIHAVDTKTEKLLWQGTVMSTLRKEVENVEARINQAVSKIFKEYPSSSK